jgi:hypothetical protein
VLVSVRPPVSETELLAIRQALETAWPGVDPKGRPKQSAWSATAAREAVGDAPRPECYALSPRSTRGATRA